MVIYRKSNIPRKYTSLSRKVHGNLLKVDVTLGDFNKNYIVRGQIKKGLTVNNFVGQWANKFRREYNWSWLYIGWHFEIGILKNLNVKVYIHLVFYSDHDVI